MKLRTCVTPDRGFVFGIHKPAYTVANLRGNDAIEPLGLLADGRVHDNRANFPARAVDEPAADWVYEIANVFPFRGATYIGRAWADRAAADIGAIGLPAPPSVSMHQALRGGLEDENRTGAIFARLPEPVLLALAATSTDPEDLVALARLCCEFIDDPQEPGRPAGLRFKPDARGRIRPVIRSHDLFETLANNPHLPDGYKEVMVLRPGAQGGSEIVGEWPGSRSHVFEYLRRNSYIPWGHYAANMANDAVRYRMAELGREDITGLRHLYYQRTYVRLGTMLGIELPGTGRPLAPDELETLRQEVMAALAARDRDLPFTATLWGWNFGFDFAPSGYRLHASHQQIHQQYALVSATVPVYDARGRQTGAIPSYGCGDLVADFIDDYRREHDSDFFSDYLRAIRGNRRMDNDPGRERSLIVFEDDQVILFVPKAQTSQWELQLMTKAPVGNILEAGRAMRDSLDYGLLLAQQALAALGARLVTSIEYPKRFNAGDTGQRLLYSLLPRLPQSPGAFSEAQLRFIIGHYPEDFAAACRTRLAALDCGQSGWGTT
ncbi:MAG: hypothetical protein L3J03_11085 [Desulfobacterales bacterium]|nr:hypothetical protein [Desulfobacterales bacterium]